MLLDAPTRIPPRRHRKGFLLDSWRRRCRDAADLYRRANHAGAVAARAYEARADELLQQGQDDIIAELYARFKKYGRVEGHRTRVLRILNRVKREELFD